MGNGWLSCAVMPMMCVLRSTGLLPFASLFYGQASRYAYYDEEGVGHEVLQGEGGEQGDPLMPGLHALGQHAALLDLHSQLQPGEGLYAFLDDVYITCPPERTLPALRAVQASLSRLANVQTLEKLVLRTRLERSQLWACGGATSDGRRSALLDGKLDRTRARTGPDRRHVTRCAFRQGCAQGRHSYLLQLAAPLSH